MSDRKRWLWLHLTLAGRRERAAAKRYWTAVRADAWDEGHEEGCAVPHGCPAHENPYQVEDPS